MPLLVCDRVVYYSQGDEKAFFDWLASIKSVRRWHGEGTRLNIHVPKNISARGLSELDALFQRYGVDRKQLAQLMRRPG